MTNTDLASFHAIVKGRVQGVFFRVFVKSHANALGLTGYVRNLSKSDTLEVQAEGEKQKLEELIQVLHQGPTGARVEKVEAKWRNYSGDYSGFSVTH